MDKEITNINGQTGGNIPDGLPIPSRYWAILAIGLGVTVSVLDGAIANVALPTIAGDLHTSPSASIWVVNAYQLAITISLLSLSSMGEIWGYRKVYTIGLLLFSCTSLACADYRPYATRFWRRCHSEREYGLDPYYLSQTFSGARYGD